MDATENAKVKEHNLTLPENERAPLRVKAKKGALVQCDPSIKAMLVKINKENKFAYIIEELNDEALIVKPEMVDDMKQKLNKILQNSIIDEVESGDET